MRKLLSLKLNRLVAAVLIVCMAMVMSVPASFICAGDGNVAFAAKADQENENAQMGSSIKKLKYGNEKDNPEEEPEPDVFKGAGSGLKGIDISYWQGNLSDGDWKNIKKDVDFVIIRCGYGPNVTSKDDSKFKRNVEACLKYDIPYGVYLYSYATSVTGAKDEADHALRMVSGYAPDYPIYYDLEDSSVAKAGSATIQKMARAFCERITAEGYRAGVYANLDWWNNKIKTGADGYSKWVAQWSSSCTYKQKYHLWQYSSNHYIPGISQRFDVNKMMCAKSEMDSFMEGAYEVFTGTATDVENYQATVIKDNALVRTGPGKAYRQKTRLAAGTIVYITETYRNYGHIVSEDMSSVQQLETGEGVITEEGSLSSNDQEDSEGWIYLGNIADLKSIKGWVSTSEGKKLVKYSGEFVTGYVKYGSYYYGFDENGVMYKGKSAVFGDKKYYFSSSGPAILKKCKITKKTVFRTGAGTKYKKKGKFKKGKIVYVIRTSGGWSKTTGGYWFQTKDSKTLSKYPLKVVVQEDDTGNEN